ncbi:DnaJ domain-containing protein [Reichenbachiella sp. MALMAid0571]|uniref:DnaJ domain-containing protein n=1 Tax=Reichenbachiella sp. MALMAid0571 TaxID=3143939 RepID=UPI0032E0291B
MSNVYLERLELAPGATKSEIKSAYRRLSKKYHPDINKSPDAQEQFIAINEAYNFLTEVGPTPHQEAVPYDYDPYKKEYEERRKRARAYANKKAEEAQRRQEESIKYALGIFDSMAYIILAFNFLLSADYFLPVSQNQEKIISILGVKEALRSGVSKYRYDDIVFEKTKMRVDMGQLVGDVSPIATVYTTPIFGTGRFANVEVNKQKIQVHQSYGIYVVFGYFIPAIFFIALLYRFILKTLDHKFTLAIVMTGLFVFQLYMFFKF